MSVRCVAARVRTGVRLPLLLTAALLVTACGGGATSSSSSGGAGPPQGRRGDPGLRAAVAVIALERSDDHRLSAEQAGKILPLLKVLRDMREEDLQAAEAIADQVEDLLTAEQREALVRLRERSAGPGSQGGGSGNTPPEARRRPRGTPGAGPGAPGADRGGSGAGPGGPGGRPGGPPDPARRNEMRRRAIDRAIRLLESRGA